MEWDIRGFAGCKEPMREQHAHNGRREQRPSSRRPAGRGKQGGYRREHEEEQPVPFGNYDLVKRIDVGGMGEVYLARQRTAFGREVAVKIIRSDLVHDSVARKRFLREAEVNAHLKHEHILSLVEFGEEQGRMFLVTPYIAGGTLAERLQRGPMSLSEVHLLFTALVRAIAYIHKRGVVHRDLKPSNILLDQQDGQVYVRLIDFGIASIQGSTAHPAPMLTQAGHEMATIEYMAPERLDGIAAPSNDIYSLGVILCEMLTGERPSPEIIRVRLSAPMRYVVEHCTYPDPEDRFHSADQLLNVFEQAYQATVAQLAAPVAPASSAPPVAPKQSEPSSPDGSVEPEDEMPRHVQHPESPPVQPASAKPLVPPVHPIAPIIPAIAAQPAAPLNAPVVPVSSHRTFTGDDYSARTTYIDPAHASGEMGQGQATSTLASPPRRVRRRGSALIVVSLIMLALLLLIGSLGYTAFINSITATVNIAPQVHTVAAMLTIQAKPTQHSIDMTNSTVPAYILSSTKTGSQTGNTTGVKCTLFVINCQPAVSFSDIDTLATSLRQTLKAQIQQDLRTQGQANGATTVGQTYYSDSNLTANPTEGTVSNTVTVTLTEQGSVEYIKSQDIQTVARNLLTQKAQQQYGSGYMLLSNYTSIGTPVVQSVDANGVVTTKIAVGGVVQYNLSSSVIQSFQNAIKGKKQQIAQAYLAQQPGIDAGSIVVHVTYGDTLPSDIRQIHIVSLNPTNIPNVQLPTVTS